MNLSPQFAELGAVRAGDFTLTRIDINYSFSLPTRGDVRAWLRAAEFKSKTRHGRPSMKGGALYWGKSFRRWALKAYGKADEIEAPKHRLPDQLLDTQLSKWADNKLRIELVLRSKELKELNLETAKALIQAPAILWRSGEDLRDMLPKATYYRHRKGLLEYGIALRRETASKNNVVPGRSQSA